MSKDMTSLTMKDVEEARSHIGEGLVIRTPMLPVASWPNAPNARVYLKLENLQRTGSFKIRGAANKIAHLSEEEARRGVIAASAGNHAQGVALAARERGIRATIVMPEGASPAKVVATEALGASVVLKGKDYQEAYEEAMRISKESHLTFVHPYEDPFIIAGQGTVGLEIAEELPDVATVIAGVGGGGLLSGIALGLSALPARPQIIAVQPRATGTLKKALQEGKVVNSDPARTIADGLATRHVGNLTFSLLKEMVDTAVEVEETEIASAIFFLLEREHVIAEGAGAASVAALLAHPEFLKAGPVVAVVSGGNIDPFLLDTIIWRGLSSEGRILRVRTALPDRPGELASFLTAVGRLGANVQRVRHDRESPLLSPGEVGIEVELEMRDQDHSRETLAKLKTEGWRLESIGLSGPP